VNVHLTHRPPPRMTEAFEHPAGSIAVTKAGGATRWRGKLLHIHVAPSASYEMEERQEAECVAGRGIVGDRYYLGTGTYSPKPDVREVTLIEQEALDALSRNDPPLQDGPITLEPRDHRRNLTVVGVPLNHLVGRRFRVGDVILRGGRLNFPCKYLEDHAAPVNGPNAEALEQGFHPALLRALGIAGAAAGRTQGHLRGEPAMLVLREWPSL